MLNAKYKFAKKLFLESSKPEMIQKIETMFGGEKIWDEGNNFTPNKIHLIGMFDIANHYLFNDELDRSEKKEVILEGTDSRFPNEVMAAFVPGMVKGVNREIIVIKHHQKDNFFVVFCSLIHEMIHMYDYLKGPMRKMIQDTFGRSELVGQLNWGYGYGSPEEALNKAHLSKEQLPNDIPTDGRPRQYQFPLIDVGLSKATGLPMKVKKYSLSENSMYDVHGSFFKNLAYRANYIGFDVTDVFNPNVQHKLKLVKEDPDETPEELRHINSPVHQIFNRLKTKKKRLCFKDISNWFIEIQ